MVAKQGATLLLETVGKAESPKTQPDSAGNSAGKGSHGQPESERPVADESYLNRLRGAEQRMAGPARRPVDRNPVDQHSVSGRSGKGSSEESMTDGNRPVRTRMPGGVGGAGSIPAPTRLSHLKVVGEKLGVSGICLTILERVQVEILGYLAIMNGVDVALL